MTQNNIYDTANQLERDLRALPAFAKLKEAFQLIRGNEESNNLFEEFKEISQSFQMKQMNGEQPTEEEIESLQALSVKVTQDEGIKLLMESEQQISQVMEDINRIITQPLQEIYQNQDNA
ncbi:YlbF family regulator [Fundicoccus sp. Sow4_H7]|uniref:YlbF family regulator n=1 Tax=Fundicoccus sp. Sow4_H7 TaxID=3438784 RepID=UPI003F933433